MQNTLCKEILLERVVAAGRSKEMPSWNANLTHIGDRSVACIVGDRAEGMRQDHLWE